MNERSRPCTKTTPIKSPTDPKEEQNDSIGSILEAMARPFPSPVSFPQTSAHDYSFRSLLLGQLPVIHMEQGNLNQLEIGWMGSGQRSVLVDLCQLHQRAFLLIELTGYIIQVKMLTSNDSPKCWISHFHCQNNTMLSLAGKGTGRHSIQFNQQIWIGVQVVNPLECPSFSNPKGLYAF